MFRTIRRLFRSRLVKLLLLAAIVLLVVIGCQRAGAFQSELPSDGQPIATSSAAALRLANKVTAAGETIANNKSLNLTVTQEEVTSFLRIGSQLSEQFKAVNVSSLAELQTMGGTAALPQVEGLQDWLTLAQTNERLANLDLSSLSLRFGVREPEVRFTAGGHIILRGYAEALFIRQPLRLVLAPRASEGELILDFVEGKLGPIPVPEFLVDGLGTGLAKLILAGDRYVEISRIQVNPGSLVLRGRYLQ